MADKVGPNSPCPCGSGKKHKRCHGKAEVDTTSPAARAMQFHSLDERCVAELLRFARRWLRHCWSPFEVYEGELGADPENVQLFGPWAVYCYAPEGRTVVSRYLE